MFGQPHPNRTYAGHAIVLMMNLIRQLVLKIAKQGGGLMCTFWAWRVVEDSRAGLPKQRVARILCARNPKRAGQKLTTILSIFRILFSYPDAKP